MDFTYILNYVPLVLTVGGFIVWLTKLSAKVSTLETNLTQIEKSQENLNSELTQIKLTLVRIETLLTTQEGKK
jgi:hypothetical protein